MSFDWQTEEEVDWEAPIEPKIEEPKKRRRRWPWAVLVMLLLLATAVFVIVRVVYQRVEVATTNVEDELLASVTVIHNAARDEDVELFTTFLSGKDADWAAANEEVVASGNYFERNAFGLHWLAMEPQTAVISTTLAPELKRAEVLSEYQYEFSVGDGISDTISLQRTAVYRLGPNRWLLAPPDDEFWGETKTLKTRYFTVTYPERDKEIVQKLVADLEVKWVEYCYLLAEDCDHDDHFNIVFSTDPGSVALYGLDPLFTEQNVTFSLVTFSLATPTLVGKPTNNKAYKALYNGYAIQMFVPFLYTEFDRGCCGHDFVEYLTYHFLAELGILLPVNTSVDWEMLVDNHTPLHQIDGSWQSVEPEMTEQERQLIKASLLFLIEEVGISPIHLFKTINQATEPTFFEYILANYPDQYQNDIDIWEREWRQFVLEQAQQTEHVDPLPKQDLLMLCQPDWAEKFALYRYDFTTGITILAQDFDYRFARGAMLGLPDDSGIAMAGFGVDSQPLGAFLLQNNVRHDLVWDENNERLPSFLPTRLSSAGNYLLWETTGNDAPDGQGFGVLDIDTCLQQNQCALNLGTSTPIWSFVDDQIIGLKNPPFAPLIQEDLLSLRSGDGSELLDALGFGALPFWIDEERFGFVQYNENGRSEIFISNINANDEPEQLISANELILAIPDIAIPLMVEFVQLDPNDPNILLLMVEYIGDSENGRFLLTYNLETGELERRWTLDPERFGLRRVYNISPNNEWLLTNHAGLLETERPTYLFHHLQSGATITMPINEETTFFQFMTDWSQDGEWFAYSQNGIIQLFAPDESSRHEIIADGLLCSNPVWTNRAQRDE